MNLRFANLLSEALHAHSAGHDGKAASCLNEALGLIAPKPAPWAGRPEDDPSRTEADRAAWREARGA